MKKYIYIIFATVAMLSSCSMDEVPQAQISKDVTFSSENGLKMYSYSFYNMLPSITDAYRKDAMCDYGAVGTIDNFLQKDSYSAAITSGWSWSELRNINYFIANCNQPEVEDQTNSNYIGIARFFRAVFYYDMVVRYGDVPWIDKPLQLDDEELYAPRDSRETVMSNVLADLDFACENILATEGDGSIITKGVAYGLKSRICLFEGTFRKYHTELGLTSSVDMWLNEAASAAKYIMDSGAYSINTKEGPAASLRALFISDKPVQNEVMLASCASQELGILGDANWWWTSSTYGLRFSMTRTFMNTFLNLDGTPY
ncbi:MAG: RagB/SusD family nutrient uptake outer membrane protein, partial [Massilibacteroides sp.]|nr:RagB/SusD family nutrient uptake outer membrane protein [Massilibacteroides sp.]